MVRFQRLHKCLQDLQNIPQGGFDINGNLRLVRKFSERHPEAFFAMFEGLADVRTWPDSARASMLQCVLTGRAH